MPLYDYHCAGCQADIELLVRGSDPNTPVCPNCGSADLQRQLSRIAPPGQSAGLIARARRQARAEGHFSNYSRAERAKLGT